MASCLACGQKRASRLLRARQTQSVPSRVVDGDHGAAPEPPHRRRGDDPAAGELRPSRRLPSPPRPWRAPDTRRCRPPAPPARRRSRRRSRRSRRRRRSSSRRGKAGRNSPRARVPRVEMHVVRAAAAPGRWCRRGGRSPRPASRRRATRPAAIGAKLPLPSAGTDGASVVVVSAPKDSRSVGSVRGRPSGPVP